MGHIAPAEVTGGMGCGGHWNLASLYFLPRFRERQEEGLLARSLL